MSASAAAERPLSTNAVHSARPTVRVDGQEDPKVRELLLAMEMIESEGGLSTLELRFGNVASNPSGGAALAFEANDVLKLGAAIAVYGGDVTKPQEIFAGTITGLEAEFPEDGPPELVVLAEDVFQRARMTRSTKLHQQKSIADIAKAVAQTVGLTPKITAFTDKIGTWVQLNESDLSFLRRLLARYDGDLQVVGSELQVSPRSQVQRGTLQLEFTSQLRRARILADLAHQVTQVTAAGWDAAQGQRVKATSTGANLGPGAGKTGAAELSPLGDRSEHVGHLAVTTAAEATALADAGFDRRARRFVSVEGLAEGNPALRVGTHVTLTHLSPRFDNTYYVVEATHRVRRGARLRNRIPGRVCLSRRGVMSTAPVLDLPAPGLLGGSCLAEVVAVNDPDGLTRVKVRLLSFDDVDQQDAEIWARVATPFAGDKYGAFMLPDVGDEVLVTFVNDDPRLPVVVGSLWNGKAKPKDALGGSGTRVDRWTLIGKAGTRIAIVEEQQSDATIKLSTPGNVTGTLTDTSGGKVEFAAAGSTITIDSSGITITSSSKVTVKGTQVDVTAGQVKVDAAMSTFSGMVKCDVLKATTVIAETYTPGAGNIW